MFAFGMASNFMPPQASTGAPGYDTLYLFLLVASFIASVILLGGMVWFVLKYKRRSNNDKTAYITHNHFLEFLWSFIPLTIFLGVFAWGAYVYYDGRVAPENALEIHVTGKQWMWNFEYRTGKQLTNELKVPLGKPVKLLMTSEDVIHSFYVPSFRIKQDVVPGMYTTLWFEATQLGEFNIFCAEFCGAAHANMLAKIQVVSEEEFSDFLYKAGGGAAKSLAEKGQEVFNTKGCVACHSMDGSRKVGPSLNGIFGTSRELMAGPSVVADENYLRESILNPMAKVVKGFAPSMPAFQGVLEEEELNAVIDFIKSTK